jgi:hypothetical protein
VAATARRFCAVGIGEVPAARSLCKHKAKAGPKIQNSSKKIYSLILAYYQSFRRIRPPAATTRRPEHFLFD